ncbi:hypothetical protein V8F33_003699 [Rhypophila sp. PSN 637]
MDDQMGKKWEYSGGKTLIRWKAVAGLTDFDAEENTGRAARLTSAADGLFLYHNIQIPRRPIHFTIHCPGATVVLAFSPKYSHCTTGGLAATAKPLLWSQIPKPISMSHRTPPFTFPGILQPRYPQLWVLNVALGKIYKGQKVPEHIRGPALIRHFFTFDVLSNNKDVAAVVRFTEHLKTLYELSQSHETWLAASDQGSTTRLTYVSPAYVLAAMCAFGGAIPPPCKQYWHFYEWMLHDSSSWPARMPAFWKHSKFDNANWVQSHFGPESWFRVTVPKVFKELELDAWLGPGRRKRDTVDWRGSDYGHSPEYHQDWETILRDPESTIKPPAWIKEAVNSSGGTYANSRTSTSANSGGRLEAALSQAMEKGAWQEAIELAKRRLREIERSYDEISPDNLAALPQMLTNLVDLSLTPIMKTGGDALAEQLEKKKRAIAVLVAERDKIEQSIASLRQGQQDCQITIAKICAHLADRTRRLA